MILLDLFLGFLEVGCFSFGGAYGAIPLIRDVVLNAGAEMVVAIAGDILRMPGLPRDPQANHIDYVDGEIIGLS